MFPFIWEPICEHDWSPRGNVVAFNDRWFISFYRPPKYFPYVPWLHVYKNPFRLDVLKALVDYWKNDMGTKWFKDHPIFQVTNLQCGTACCFCAQGKTYEHIVLSEVEEPQYVVPLRLFGDGADSYRT